MASLSTANKKVARAARTGGGSIRAGSRPMGYYAALTIIVVLGLLLVGYSRNERLSATSPGGSRPYAPWTDASKQPKDGDSWSEAYGVYLCDKFADNIAPGADPYGVTTNNDGVIAIAPKEKKYAGRNMTLGLFAKSTKMKITRDAVQLPGGEEYKNGRKCGDKTGRVVVREWTKAGDDKTAKEIKSDPTTLLLKDGAALTIAFVPEDKKVEDIPAPASATGLSAKNAGITGGATPASVPNATPNATGVPAESTPTTGVAPTSAPTTAPASK